MNLAIVMLTNVFVTNGLGEGEASAVPSLDAVCENIISYVINNP